MTTIIQCTSCTLKLRVRDQLLGKTVKCPNCQTKFVAKAAGESRPQLLPAANPPETPVARDSGPQGTADDLKRTPVNPQAAPGSAPALEITEPASAPSNPSAALPRSSGRVATSTPIPPEPGPPPPPKPPQPFETSPLMVLAVLAALLLLAAFIGCGSGWWIGAVVENASTQSGTTRK
jgi:hypothetical protein